MRRAVFLDRDGTLVRAFPEGETTRGPRLLSEIEILPGAIEAIRLLQDAGWYCISVSNQPDVARGIVRPQLAREVDLEVAKRLCLNGHYICVHHAQDLCCCRKPKPGLLYVAAYNHGIDLSASWMVGDRATDDIAGQTAGCRTSMVETNSGIKEACQWILKTSG